MRIQVLDHGYVEEVEHWGSDERIIEAARMSTGKGFLSWMPEWECPTCGDKWYGEEVESNRGGIPACNRGEKCSNSPMIKKHSGDYKLLRFLWEHKHTTPFEMAGMTIEVQAPIFVFREWHRHRTQCLSGDTKIACVSPRGTTYMRTIRQIFELKRGVVDHARVGELLPPGFTRNGYSKAGTLVLRRRRLKRQTEGGTRIRVLPNCQSRTLRVCIENVGEFTTGSMADVWEAGVKEIFSLETTKGFSIKASAAHPFLTESGWVKLKDLRAGDRVARMGKVASSERPIPPALRSGIGVWTSMMRSRLIKEEDRCYICGGLFQFDNLILDHVIPVSDCLLTALDERNLKPACIACSREKTNSEQPSRTGMSRRGVRWEKLRGTPSPVGEEMTYDMEVKGPHHNYVANGFVVHNSYNEMSARYTPLPDVNYIPTVERLMMGSDGKNRQAGTVAGAEVLTTERAEKFRTALVEVYKNQQLLYEEALHAGVPKELARVHLPVGRYSRMRASANLLNWLRFLTLRMSKDAQYEIRQFASAAATFLFHHFPRTWDLFAEGLSIETRAMVSEAVCRQ
jgi:flavin-dependent thymidylate synthase